MSIPFEEPDGVNPFQLLADDLPPGDSMGAQSLVVVGANDADGRPGFVLLADRADVTRPGSGHGEDLQDHVACPPPAEVMGK
jgi:CDP-diacylglycerol pyrophosphatase